MKIKFEYNRKNINLELGKLNIFYGYNNSGKTTIAKIINDGFNQKFTTPFQVNGYQAIKSDFETIFLDLNNSLDEQLKLGSKSLIKRKYLNGFCEIVDKNNDFEQYFVSKFTNCIDLLNALFTNINNGLNNKLYINLDLQTIEDIILSNIKISYTNNNISSSDSKLLLLKIVLDYININNTHKIIILDDFDCVFDEVQTLKILNLFEEAQNTTFLLFTSKPSSLQFALGKYNVFTIRQYNIYDLSNIKKLINSSLISSTSSINISFEDYIINNHIIILENEYMQILNELKENSYNNLGRMLVNQYYVLNDNKDGYINIHCENEIEYNLLKYLDSLFNNY